jgi:hypothetical protein
MRHGWTILRAAALAGLFLAPLSAWPSAIAASGAALYVLRAWIGRRRLPDRD